MKNLFVVILVATFALIISGQENKASAQSMQMLQSVAVTPETVKWNDRGVAILSGLPDKEGSPFVMRIKFPDGTKIMPHWHPIDENVTVISGMIYMGMGEKFDEAIAKEMPTGSFGMMPKEMRHFFWVKGETIIQIHGVGPFKTFWVNPPESQDKKNPGN